MKLNEFKKLVRKLIVQEAKKDPKRFSLNFGWGVKDKEHPDIPWVRGPKEDALHDDKEVFSKFFHDILGFDPAKASGAAGKKKEDKK